MKESMIISAVVASLLLGGSLLQASSESKISEKSVKDASSVAKYQKSKTSVEKEVQTQNQSFKNAPKEIMLGLSDTFNAIKLLEQNDIDSAKKSLVKATEEFNTVTVSPQRFPQLSLTAVKSSL